MSDFLGWWRRGGDAAIIRGPVSGPARADSKSPLSRVARILELAM